MKSENSQHVYRMHTPRIKTEFGTRVMSEIGNIQGLEVDDVANYILVPTRTKDEKTGREVTTSWTAYRIKTDCEVEVESWKNLEKET